MKTNYQYPLEPDWSAKDIETVTTLYRHVEDAYELPQGVNRAQLLASYLQFKTVVDSKALEKNLGRQFEQVSNYSIYKTVQAAKKIVRKKMIKMS